MLFCICLLFLNNLNCFGNYVLFLNPLTRMLHFTSHYIIRMLAWFLHTVFWKVTWTWSTGRIRDPREQDLPWRTPTLSHVISVLMKTGTLTHVTGLDDYFAFRRAIKQWISPFIKTTIWLKKDLILSQIGHDIYRHPNHLAKLASISQVNTIQFLVLLSVFKSFIISLIPKILTFFRKRGYDNLLLLWN